MGIEIPRDRVRRIVIGVWIRFQGKKNKANPKAGLVTLNYTT